ncbi:hypothetical protein CL654_01980 [bacterium]|nr:hypothetical protein [bacterium]|tara:strand:+ start:27899 stop:28585 length:687 start_codon:yes stop_codon:yes gene_type:complete
MALWLGVTLSLLLGVIHFYNEKFNIPKQYKQGVVSFVGGVSVAYAFLFLLPDVYLRVGHFGSGLYFLLLFGFAAIHFLEKTIYRGNRGVGRVFWHGFVHVAVLFLYYFMVGSILLPMLENDTLQGILFFLPLAFYGMIGIMSFEAVHHAVRKYMFLRLFLSASAILGILTAYVLSINKFLMYHALFAVVVGGFLYIAFMDFIPQKNKGAPIYFIAGVIIYSLIIFLTL